MLQCPGCTYPKSSIFHTLMLRPDGRRVRHRFEMLGEAWWFLPLFGLTSFLFMTVWPGYWGYPIVIVTVGFFMAGIYLSFWSVHYVAHVCINQLVVGMCFIWIMVGGSLSGAAVVALKASTAVGIVIAIGAALLLFVATVWGAVRAARRDWGASQPWLAKNASLKRFRAWDAEIDAPRGRLRSAAAMGVIAIALVNIAGYLWLGNAQAFRIMLLPSLAVAMSIVLVRGAYVVFGAQLAAVVHLRRIEKAMAHRFVLGNIEDLHRERRAHWLGRFIAPRTLSLDPVHESTGSEANGSSRRAAGSATSSSAPS